MAQRTGRAPHALLSVRDSVLLGCTSRRPALELQAVLLSTRTRLVGGQGPTWGPWHGGGATRVLHYFVAPARAQVLASYTLPWGDAGKKSDHNCVGGASFPGRGLGQAAPAV